MSRDQFVWGLSNGVGVLAISGGLWLGLAAWGVGFTTLLIALAAQWVSIVLVGGICSALHRPDLIWSRCSG